MESRQKCCPAILIVVAILIVAGAGLYIWKGGEKSNNTPNDYSDWKNFENIEGGYSFQYPKEWNAAVNKYNSKNSLFGPGATSESGSGGVEFQGNLSSSQTLKDFVKNFNSGIEAGSISEKEETINGQPVIVSILPKAGLDARETKSVSFEKGGIVFSIYLGYRSNFNQYPEDGQMLEKFNQMLQTFKIK